MAAATLVGIVVSIRQRAIRRVIVPDYDAQLDAAGVIGSGERMWKVALTTYQSWNSPDNLDSWVAAQEGTAATTDRLCVLNGQGQLVYALLADSQIDGPGLLAQLPNGYSLVETTLGDAGETWPFHQPIDAGMSVSRNAAVAGPN